MLDLRTKLQVLVAEKCSLLIALAMALYRPVTKKKEINRKTNSTSSTPKNVYVNIRLNQMATDCPTNYDIINRTSKQLSSK
jgi:hypothetical protein